MKVKNDHRNKRKNQGFNGIRTRDLRDTSAMLNQQSYEAKHWERGQLIEFISSRKEFNDVKYIWNDSYLNCDGYRWKWRMIMAVNFRTEAIGMKKPEKKKSGLQRNSSPWPVRYQCDALPTELWIFMVSSFHCLSWKIYCNDHWFFTFTDSDYSSQLLFLKFILF